MEKIPIEITEYRSWKQEIIGTLTKTKEDISTNFVDTQYSYGRIILEELLGYEYMIKNKNKIWTSLCRSITKKNKEEIINMCYSVKKDVFKKIITSQVCWILGIEHFIKIVKKNKEIDLDGLNP